MLVALEQEFYPLRVAIRKNEYLRGYTYDFIELFAPHLTREVVAKAMHNQPEPSLSLREKHVEKRLDM